MTNQLTGRGAKKGERRALKDGPKRKMPTFRIREDLLKALEAQADKEGRKAGLIVDDAIQAYLLVQSSHANAESP